MSKLNQLKIVGNIYSVNISQTSELIPLETNRDKDDKHILKIAKSYLENGYLKTSLIVNQNGEIIDGNHRFFAWVLYHTDPKFTNDERFKPFDILFTIADDYGVDETRLLNTVPQQKWSVADYIKSWANKGFESYRIFKEFRERTGLGISECTSLLRNVNNRASGKHFSDLKKGKLIITPEQLAHANEMVDILNTLTNFQNCKSLTFITQYLSLRCNKKYNHEAFMLGWDAISDSVMYRIVVDGRSGKEVSKPITDIDDINSALRVILKQGLKLLNETKVEAIAEPI